MSATAKRLSFEFFPPKTPEGKQKLLQVHDELRALEPEFFSVTYGAGGSTRERTREVVLELSARGATAAPHVSFAGDDEEIVLQLLLDYRARGIDRLVAIRGDLPSGYGVPSRKLYAENLVRFIREKTGAHFHIDVACYPEVHPQSSSFDSDIANLRRKLDAGANGAITQFFYNADAYFYLLDACAAAGITQPICPGIMPILNHDNLARFARNCGAEIPRWLHYRLASLSQDELGLREFSDAFLTDFCTRLLAGGAPGLHFFAMNRVEPCLSICRAVGFG